MKKILNFVLALALVFALVACGETPSKPSEPEGPDFELNKKTELLAGFTSLENQNANPEVDAEGKYVYAGQTFQTVKEFKTIYQTEIDNMNYLTNNWTYNSEHYTNMIDGLVENDQYGNIVGALAAGYKSEIIDGVQKWQFQLKEGVAWVENATGKIHSEVVAQNFVDSIKYVLDPINGSKTAGIINSQIAGAAAYYKAMTNGEAADFSTVGVRVVSKYVVEYTTIEPMPYFLTCLTYSPYLPVDGEYLEAEGTDFGSSEDHLLVNGAFRITNHVLKSSFSYTKNESYWDAKHVYVDKVIKRYYDSQVTNPSTTRLWFENGYIDSFGVNVQDADGWNKYVVGLDESGKPLVGEAAGTIKNPKSEICNSVIGVGDATYIGYFNFVRTYWSDAERTEAQKENTAIALRNVNFRKGFLYGLDVMAQLEYYGANGINYLMRGYTNRELVSAGGKDYADYVEDVFNREQGTEGQRLAGIYNGSDPVYDAAKAQAFFATAKEELLAAGMPESAFPIQIDVVVNLNATYRAFEKNMYDHLEANSNGVIKVNQLLAADATQRTEWMNKYNNYDFSLLSGWGPDYADPKTYLATFAIGGDLVEQLGFDGTEATAALEAEILGEYDALYRAAAAIVEGERLIERFQAFAEAEYKLIYEYALIVPWEAANAYSASVARTVAHQAAFTTYGLSTDKLKNVVVTDGIITKEQRAAINEYWESHK